MISKPRSFITGGTSVVTRQTVFRAGAFSSCVTRPLTARTPGYLFWWDRASTLPRMPWVACSQTFLCSSQGPTWLEQSPASLWNILSFTPQRVSVLSSTITWPTTPQWTPVKQPKFLLSSPGTGCYQWTGLTMQASPIIEVNSDKLICWMHVHQHRPDSE